MPLPLWHTPEQVRDTLLALPEKKRNRALYELVRLFDFDHPHHGGEIPGKTAALRLLWRDPRFQGLENIKYWLEDILRPGPPQGVWQTLQPEIESLLEVLHTETLRVYGDYGGMFADADMLKPFIGRMMALNTPASLTMARDCLYWNEALRLLRPDWAERLHHKS
ncbi:MAG: hypothetical protein Q3966_04660 [Neisseria sp.]|nr:hypothetical protein [Neisseria sp.]